MDFTFEELDELIKRGLLSKDKAYTFGINYAYKSTNQGFGSYSIEKKDNGEIHFHSSQPYNVDPDDASYNMEYREEYYYNFKDYLENKPYKKDVRNN